MRPHKYLPTVLMTIAMLTLILVMTGCSTTPRRGGAKLSDAAAEAEKKPRAQKPLRLGEKVDDEDDDEITLSGTGLRSLDPAPAAPSAAAKASAGAAGSTSGSAAAQDDDDRQMRNNIIFGSFTTEEAGSAVANTRGFFAKYSQFEGSQFRISGGILAGRVHRGDNASIQTSFEDMSELALELEGRYYFTKDHTAMGLYSMAGLRWGLVMWNYTNPIVVINDDGSEESVENDWLQVLTPFLGLGISLLQTDSIHLGTYATYGARLYQGTTQEGLDNDVFKPVGVAQLVLEGAVFLGE